MVVGELNIKHLVLCLQHKRCLNFLKSTSGGAVLQGEYFFMRKEGEDGSDNRPEKGIRGCAQEMLSVPLVKEEW